MKCPVCGKLPLKEDTFKRTSTGISITAIQCPECDCIWIIRHFQDKVVLADKYEHVSMRHAISHYQRR